jgi:hypothetical protein
MKRIPKAIYQSADAIKKQLEQDSMQLVRRLHKTTGVRMPQVPACCT